jgi:short-subunit dehydrogenase
MASTQNTVVITGCDTGIGRALALAFHNRGQNVYATGLQAAALQELEALGLKTQLLDITKKEQIEALQNRLKADKASAHILINNAGYGAMGPTVEMSMEDVRAQYEVNVFGLLQMSQALGKEMLARRQGMIVNIGSTSGVMASPFAGVYCSTKFAVHALTDALRMEMQPFGVHVMRVEPNMIRSGFGNTAAQGLKSRFSPQSAYIEVQEAAIARAMGSQTDDAMPAEEFAEKLADGVLSKNPPIRMRLGRQLLVYTLFKPFLPSKMIDRLLQKIYKLNQLK